MYEQVDYIKDFILVALSMHIVHIFVLTCQLDFLTNKTKKQSRKGCADKTKIKVVKDEI